MTLSVVILLSLTSYLLLGLIVSVAAVKMQLLDASELSCDPPPAVVILVWPFILLGFGALILFGVVVWRRRST